jgi:hypothetical protein
MVPINLCCRYLSGGTESFIIGTPMCLQHLFLPLFYFAFLSYLLFFCHVIFYIYNHWIICVSL